MPGEFAPAAGPGPLSRGKRRRGLGWVIAAAVAFVLIAAAVGVHLWALDSYTRATEDLDAALAEAETVRLQLDDATDDAVVSGLIADRVHAAASGEGVADPGAVNAFATALAEFHTAVSDSQAVLDEPLPEGMTQPTWTWELFAGADRLEAAAAEADAAAAEVEDTAARLDGAAAALEDSAAPLFASVEPAADALEAANISARTGAVLDFREAADAVVELASLDPAAASAFERLALR